VRSGYRHLLTASLQHGHDDDEAHPVPGVQSLPHRETAEQAGESGEREEQGYRHHQKDHP
jgi:hypothetical protein